MVRDDNPKYTILNGCKGNIYSFFIHVVYVTDADFLLSESPRPYSQRMLGS